MTEFRPIPDGDAWASIRGYVYQIDVTVLAWLDVVAPKIIELEHGEDFDIVSPTLLGETDDPARNLGQVKHRQKAITLLSKGALEALANFCRFQ